ncbi:hypothetical protein LCGC14_0890740 [marine sediment metagenome]|uniref:Uncharacterized protein n=1 Tax=marine sediment metagenome TaxID=412755 RepID=A0A0F9P458_9ZZZZ
MAKTFRYNPDEDWDTQITAKQRRQLRKADKQARKERAREFEELEESADSDT